MSDTHNEDAHTGPIKNPKQLLIAVFLSFVIPVFVIIGLVQYVSSGDKAGAGASHSEMAKAQRLQKVGQVEVRDANRPLRTGEQVYNGQCAACHANGTAGAPKFQDAAAWGPRLPQGLDALVQSSLKGKGAMAPQGGGDFSDFEISLGVIYMANAAGGKFAEPKPPAGEGAEAPAEASAPAAAEQPAPAAAEAPAPEAVAQPAAITTVPPASAAAAGKALYDKACVACHAAGVAGAPKFGDKAAWAPYVKEGLDHMLEVAIKGKGAMPPRGASTATDDELRAAIQYMVDNAK
ncbi:c-type cytochrome [Comamonas composti]|uniref:c-type cytochrome n=1 Tax=Comamonas composti TaxID=408558 RepID=UPI0003FB1600|nr:c-type cytochrome [Comamonas composti]